VPVAHGDPALRIARRDAEGGRRLAQMLHDEVAVHTDVLAGDPTACIPEDLHRLRIEKLDAKLFEDHHRRVMDAQDAVFIERFGRTVDIDRQGPGQLLDRSRPAPDGMTGASAIASFAYDGLGHGRLPGYPFS